MRTKPSCLNCVFFWGPSRYNCPYQEKAEKYRDLLINKVGVGYCKIAEECDTYTFDISKNVFFEWLISELGFELF